ncbi:hypothetical protein GCM10028824_22840 [Hymenobacter segetis]|uniref:DUF7847 domain-containing protein n=1 Tax=Hymenobacter segetis TaxID=2025509 RepID=A0ABU9M0N4_9BACT
MLPRTTARFSQESDFRRQRDFGQKFSAAFEFIGAHWRGLGRALLYIVLPAAILQGIVMALMQKEFISKSLHVSDTGISKLRQLAMFNEMYQSPFYWVNIAVSGIFIMLLVLTVYGYVKCCLRPVTSSEPITVGQVWEEVKQEFLGSYLSYFGLMVLVLIGFVFLAIPGLYLMVAFSLFYITKVVEGTGFSDTCRRCLQLVRGKWWSTCGLIVVMTMVPGIALGIIGSMVSWLVYYLADNFGLFHATEAGSSMGLFAVITSALSGLLNLLIYPPLLLALAFQYFNLVERRDGVGLRHMVDQLGRTPVPVHSTNYRPDDEGEY